MSTVFGHNQVKEWWSKAKHHSNQISAYLFSGPKHIGKRVLAEECARDLLGLSQGAALTSHPDFLQIRADDFENGKLSAEDVRAAMERLSTTPVKSPVRVVIIDGADTMGTEAQNALLKIFEEPRVPTLFFLIAENANAMLATIRSRCLPVEFQFVPHTEWSPDMQQAFADFDTRTQTYLDGRPGLYTRYMMGKRERAKIEKQISAVYALIGTSLPEQLAYIKDQAKKLSWGELAQLLDDAVLVAHREKRAPELLAALAESRAWLARYLNKTIILDHIVFKAYE